MNRHLRNAALVLVVGALAGWAIAQDGEMVDNPEYIQWSSFEVGASATLTMMSGPADAGVEVTMTHTLMSLDADNAVVTTVVTMVVNDQEIEQPPQDRTVAARVAKYDPPEGQEAPEIEESEETVTVAAGTFDCKKVTTTITANGAAMVTTVWTTDAVPGGIVKMVTTSGGQQVSSMELTAVSTGE
ncbi:MAG: hypothetical protein ACYTFO_04040 [Planctomycetota bacterium]|jgi:hypothetical protein